MDNDVVIKVDGVSKTFKLPHEKNNSIKGAVINFYKRKKTFETQTALQDISFKVQKGEFFGIVGRNGSGKSTLLKLLAGIYSPTIGTIQVVGKLTPFIELGVGFNQELSGRENVFLNGALLGFSRKEMNTMYDDIVEFAELRRFMDQKLKNYSSGMQVRLAFSIAIRARGDILLLDEVLAVGDAAFQQKCYTYFEELREQKKTVIFVSHDMGAIRRFCTKAVYIDNSRLTFNGSPIEIADVYTEENIEVSQKVKRKDNVDSNASKKNKITATITEQKQHSVTLEVDCRSEYSEDMYVGISLLEAGMAIAEINSLPNNTFRGDGKLTYTLDITVLNAEVYDISAALLRLKDKKLITFTKNNVSFVIKGDDPTKGSALKLADNWKLL